MPRDVKQILGFTLIFFKFRLVMYIIHIQYE